MSVAQCIVCGSRKWLKLPNPSARKSVTTAGSIIDEPLGKSQCAECGLVQRTENHYLGNTDFYESQYTTYYERPGVETFNKQRYAEIAKWVSYAIENFIPDSIVEAGCGRGWTLREMKTIYPHAIVEGIEPSIANSEEAKRQGIQIYVRKLDFSNIPDAKYDLVFSNHVLQHTTDPIDFLKAMGEVATNRGLIIVIIQDASVPSNELLYSDQNFAFMPIHLVRLVETAGLRVLSWKKAPNNDSLKLSQLIVCCRRDSEWSELTSDPIPEINEDSLADLYERRIQYIEAWSRIDDYLCWKTSKYRIVYNFGGGMYSYLLACYCEKYWDRVELCTVDVFSGEFLGKPVVPFEKLLPNGKDCIVIGTRPGIQQELSSRLHKLGWETISWDNFIDG